MSIKEDMFNRIAKAAVVPVVVIDDAKDALPLANALMEGGLPVAEITFRTSAAAEAIKVIANEKPGILLGAGTILTETELERAIDAGSGFGVAPGLNPVIVGATVKRGFPFAPGVATPSEVEQAMSLGARLLKFFPAEANGGVDYLKAMSAPYAHTGVRFMPTGGVKPSNLKSYLSLDSVLAVGGTWIANRELIKRKDWNAIIENCREACDIVEDCRKDSGG